METTVPIAIAVAAAVLLGLGAVIDDRRTRIRRRRQREAAATVRPLLHSINDDRCIGCEACVDVCPTEVLDLVEHKVRVLRFSDCVQCEQCANACPTQALVMYRQGTTPRMLTVPEIDEQFQTGVPGQYLIGEVAGKPLVKNAANLGRAVIEHIARQLAGAPRGDGVLDVAIVGSGPGGLSAGLTCIAHGLACQVIEKEHVLASTVARYPKGKHFMAEPSTAQNVSYLPVFDGSKEQLVAAWTELVRAVELPIKLGEAVETVVRGADGIFAIKTTVASYRARAVVLATGLRGKPRLLAVPGANLEKVQSLLDDPSEFAGEDVLVVGGGDSAVEGAMSLADAGARVTLSYRGDGFKRCKQGNQKRLAELTATGKLGVLLESNVKCFTPADVAIIKSDRSEVAIANQRAFVLIGADTPVAWLETNGVRFVERPHLYALGSTEEVVRRFAPDAAPCPRSPDDALAVLRGRPAPGAAARRVRSVAQHLRDEIRGAVTEVVTSVSAVFRLSELDAGSPAGEPPPAAPPPVLRAGTHSVVAPLPTRPRAHTRSIAAPAPERLRPPTQSFAAPAPERPRASTKSIAVPPPRPLWSDDTTATMPSLRALELAARGETTATMPSLRALELAAQTGSAAPVGEAKTIVSASLRMPEPSSRIDNALTTTPPRAIEQGDDFEGKTAVSPSLRTLESAAPPDTILDQPSLRTLAPVSAGARPATAAPIEAIIEAIIDPPALHAHEAAVPPTAVPPTAVAPTAAAATPPRRPPAVPPPIPRRAPAVPPPIRRRPPAVPPPQQRPVQLARGSECMPRHPGAAPPPSPLPAIDDRSEEARTEELSSLRALEVDAAKTGRPRSPR